MERNAPCANRLYEENGMDMTMPCTGAHPAPGEEVMVMDDVDVAVCLKSVSSISHSKERMGKDEQ
jgi:hypothetical protein